jgi:hypothetical protein
VSRPPRKGKLLRAESAEQTLALAIAEITRAERAEDMDEMRERLVLARGFVAEAMEQVRKATC